MSVTNSSPRRPSYRALTFGVTRVELREGLHGIQYLKAEQPLGDYAQRITDRLLHWAHNTPDRTFMAQRMKNADGSSGDWQHISYAQALASARSIAQALIDRGLSPERPVAILSENDLEHALLALGCIYAGVPYCPVSPAYSTVSQDYDKLRHVLATLTPGLVFASDASRYGKAIAASVAPEVEVATQLGAFDGRSTTPFSSLLAITATPAADAAMHSTGPDTIVKFLFTSGSTRLPKAVINTQRMWCANQQQMRQSMPMLQEPPVLVDWLPWNHTFGGNHNFGMVVYNGGTLYIDDGKPTPALMGETLRNLREIAPTAYFNVPSGFEAIANAMQAADAPGLALRKKLLSKVQMFFYAGAAMGQAVWDRLHAAQEAELGERIVMGTGLGMTESAPFGLFVTSPRVKSGDLGLPTPGMRLKLVLNQGKTEVRYQGPNITPGYWRQPESTQSAFDEEGYFLTGDAVTWIDPQDIHQGLRFDGRIAEDFKLATGTFASVGPLRARLIAAGAPYVQDAVITGHGLSEIGALVLPTAALRAACGVAADAPEAALADSALATQLLAAALQRANAGATGSASRVARALWLQAPPSIDHGEVTDKGSINQSAVLKHRALVVAALHAASVPGIVFAP